LNGAFAALLRALGFLTTLLSARVARDAGGERPEFDHLTLRVDMRIRGWPTSDSTSCFSNRCVWNPSGNRSIPQEHFV